MITLGIYNIGADPSAAIIRDGHAIAYVEEERLLRLKHADGIFPIRAIEQVMAQTQVDWLDIDHIAVPWDCQKYDDGRMAAHYNDINQQYNIIHPNDITYEQRKLKEFQSERQRGIILRQLRRRFGNIDFPEIHFVNHHLSHACTAFFTSGYEEALVLTLDGSGEEVTIAVWEGAGSQLKLLKEVKTPISLGWFFSAFTEYLGFNAYGDEWQVMGLASYGEENEAYLKARSDYQKIIWYNGEGGVEGDPHLLSLGDKSFSSYCPDAFATLMGRAPRLNSAPIEQWHIDAALAAQHHLETIVAELVKFWASRIGTRRLCLAGGVAMNVKMNGNLFESDLLDSVHVYPIASDCGTSIGAGMASQYLEQGGLNQMPVQDVYLGNAYSDSDIESVLQKCKLAYRKSEHLAAEVAKLILDGKTVGWFQQAMEGGQRALGARSILADPRQEASRDVVNSVIKYRQRWRPFCPSMLQEDALKYFVHWDKLRANLESPAFKYMTMTLTANNQAKKEIPAVVHEDGTSRIQIVDEYSNPRYYALLKALQAETGIGVILNTSFNIKGEPIVCTPQDAIRTFFATGLDILVLGDCLLTK